MSNNFLLFSERSNGFNHDWIHRRIIKSLISGEVNIVVSNTYVNVKMTYLWTESLYIIFVTIQHLLSVIPVIPTF